MLNKDNAQQHCLTCLLKLDMVELMAGGDDNSNSNKNSKSSVHFALDLELQQMLGHHLNWPIDRLPTELPQQLCLDCYNQLQQFQQFLRNARDSYEQLLAVLQQPNNNFEIVYEEQAQAADEQLLYRELLKSSALLEPEAVLLEATPAETPPLHSVEPPDPFDVELEETVDKPTRCARQRQRLAAAKTGRCKGHKNSFKCGQCQQSYAHKLTLNAHVRKVHEGQKRPFQCDKCDKSYSFMGGLYTHIKEIHEPQVRRYACDQEGCERIYTSFISMQKHKRLKHSAVAPSRKYVCEQCGATFNQTANLNYHRRSKHPTAAEAAQKARDSENHYCELCQKQFHSRYTLKYHNMQQHGEQPADQLAHECLVCGRRVAKKFMLVQHMLVHSDDKMPCEHCGKLFVRKFELEAHVRAVHLKLKPFACKYCAECFASRKTLRHHEYIHTGEKPYVCDICGQAYRQQTCLKKHRKVHETPAEPALLPLS